ncbi:hypothetical protein FY528_03620 [Hymenobacter lutimineralis]|uniref:Uncharacterized protein n=1 Tax=Hymenobacter lutimineralis TaxID=2606448 RepID=A0A5D6VDP3_9BACT|nr:hypothetical protein [Hymenobacter lutimineralis]TYZ13510.1 hypothetical protein FY528_03620 [Hymenobacter lutimineralis]
MNIALVSYAGRTSSQYAVATVEDEDTLLERYLLGQGHQVTIEIWSDAAVNWQQYEAVVLKSPWDYFDRIAEFYAWLDSLEKLGVSLLNPISVVRWNADKRYLLEMAEAGVSVVPTQWLARGSSLNTADLFAALRAPERIIIKPAVSGGAKNTFALTAAEAAARSSELAALLAEEDFLAQPFLPQIQTQGEWSLVYLGGAFSHSVLKTPKSGDFRVQHYLGGGIAALPAPASVRQAADDTVRRFAAGCLYARVDGVVVDGQFLLMELELIEPFLYLATEPASWARYEQALRTLAPLKGTH